MHTYDTFIIGAGINGAALAYMLAQRGQKVMVFDQEGVASGGSGAAGAFINPKVSKSGPLKELIETAYRYSLDFYTKNFPESTTTAPLLHIAKTADENDKVAYFKEHTSLNIGEARDEVNALLTEYASSFSAVYLKESAIVEAKDVCKAMLHGVEYCKMRVDTPQYQQESWCVGAYRAKKMVLCTGAYDEIFKEPYLKFRRVYGQRCEVKSSTFMPSSIHHEVSVSATKKNGCIAIGASHYLNKEDLPSEKLAASQLLALACKSVKLEDLQVLDVYEGMRSGSNDYLPIVGPLLKSDQDTQDACSGDYRGLYMMNGAGGYGFVLAPYLAELMSRHLLDGQKIPSYLLPERFYTRWLKKEKKVSL